MKPIILEIDYRYCPQKDWVIGPDHESIIDWICSMNCCEAKDFTVKEIPEDRWDEFKITDPDAVYNEDTDEYESVITGDFTQAAIEWNLDIEVIATTEI